MHSFAGSDYRHPQTLRIYAKLEEIHSKLLNEGYAPGKNEDVVCDHSEKLAIAYALINTLEGVPIHVTKNMFMCGDCHLAISLFSRIEKRRIQVNDANRVHIFYDGKCICNDDY